MHTRLFEVTPVAQRRRITERAVAATQVGAGHPPAGARCASQFFQYDDCRTLGGGR